MVLYPSDGEKVALRQPLLSVYLQSLLYYDTIFSFFALTLQYFLFIYKYNILVYSSPAMSVELILLTILLFFNWPRLTAGRSGTRGRRYLQLGLFIMFGVLLVLGYVYVAAIQANALYLQVILSYMGVLLTGTGILLCCAVMVLQRVNE